ncbi:Colicin-E7 [Photorhabdus namnaonensis]|uniref:Colicin-E7 n=1 Tax=Photorhabdus namnaonensis TaxID=1851568 RepID=A0A1B8YJU6_9GAMM|nr:Colicin-E7 [Photorhabdus namnaonensis]
MPEAACYLSPDPTGLWGGENTYAYVTNPAGWVDPLGLSRCSAGAATGNGKSITNKWLKGSHGNAGLFPASIAEKMKGKTFKSFDDFRETFWKEVAKDPHLSQEFSKSNITRMLDSKAPISHNTQWNGKNRSYVLHHRTPIQHGGGVYDMDNILIVTPKYHLDVLDRSYHF